MARSLSAFLADLRYAARQLRRSSGFTLTALLTLALSIGATITMVRVGSSVLLEPLPYPQQDRLVGVAFTLPQKAPNNGETGATANFLVQHSRSFQSVAVYAEGTSGVNLATDGGSTDGAVQVSAQSVDRSFFPTLGVKPLLGRTFSSEEDQRSGSKAVLLSYGLWQRLFNGDSGVIGKVVHLNGESADVVGVMPAGLAFGSDDPRSLSAQADIWQPLKLDTKDPGYYGDNYNVLARLREGVSINEAQQELTTLNQPLYKEFPSLLGWLSISKAMPEFRLWPLQAVLVSNIRTSLLVLTAAVIAVLLIACFNLAGLMAARASKRQREIALRSALGASRFSILRLLISESLLLAVLGSAFGVVAARFMLPALLVSSPLPIPQMNGNNLAKLIAFTLPIAVGVTLLCGLLPSWLILQRNSSSGLQAGHSVGATASDSHISRILLVLQTAIAVLLLSAASLLLGSFLRLRSTPSGLQAEHLSVAQVNLKGADYAETLSTTQFVHKVIEQLQSYPGAKRVAAINGLPLDRGLNISMPPTGAGQIAYTVELRLVTPGYFQTVGIPVLTGRDIADSDRADSAPVIVVSQAIAKKLWPGKSPVGEQIKGFYGKDKIPVTIIGVVADAHSHSLAEEPQLMVYEPFVQQSDSMMKMLNGWFRTSFVIRSAADLDLAAPVQQAIHDADPGIPISRFTTMQAIIDHSLARPRFFSSLVTSFAGFALLLMVIGLFGLLSYQVTQRTREIGVRIALGATRQQILTFILSRGLKLTLIGLALGGAGSLLLPRLIRSMLDDNIYTGGKGVETTFSGVSVALVSTCGVMILSALLASYFPARRASSIEPIEALRIE
jgi:predicted permease